jgi:hypothetical protein
MQLSDLLDINRSSIQGVQVLVHLVKHALAGEYSHSHGWAIHVICSFKKE